VFAKNSKAVTKLAKVVNLTEENYWKLLRCYRLICW